MIEKLNTAYIQVESDSNAKLELANKINELVYAVNGILDYAPLEMAMKAEPKTPADLYAEQRRWIGCLVRYKIVESCQGGWYVDGLDEIDDDLHYPFKMRNGTTAEVCELVTADEIYPNKARTW